MVEFRFRLALIIFVLKTISADLLYSLVHVNPPYISEPSDLYFVFQFSEPSLADDKLKVVIPKILETQFISLDAEFVYWDANNNENKIETYVGYENEDIKIELLLNPDIEYGEIRIIKQNDGSYSFINPDQYDKYYTFQMYYNFELQYLDQWKPSELLPRINFLKGGPFNVVPGAETQFYGRFTINRFSQKEDKFRLYLHPEITVDEQVISCSVNVQSIEVTLGFVSPQLICEVKEDAETYTYYIEVSFANEEKEWRPYTKFQFEISPIKNSDYKGRYTYEFTWFGESQQIQDQKYLSFFIRNSMLEEFCVSYIKTRIHALNSELTFKIQTNQLFNEKDRLILDMYSFGFDPFGFTSYGNISYEGEPSSTSSWNIDPINAIVTISDLDESYKEIELTLTNVRNPLTSSEYLIYLDWMSESELVASAKLKIPMQFLSFSFVPQSNEYLLENQEYILSFSFYQEIGENWKIIVIFPFQFPVPSNSLEFKIGGNIGICEITEVISATYSFEALINFPESYEAEENISITFSGIDNPLIPGNSKFEFLIKDSENIKKGVLTSEVEFKCPTQEYFDSYYEMCLHCISPCLECSNSADNCTTCIAEAYFLDEYSCTLHCPSGTYSKDGYCKECAEGCSTCSESECFKCFIPFSLNSEGRCEICKSSNCGVCNSTDRTICIECLRGYYFIEGSCRSCSQNCNECSESPEKCVSCKLDHYLFENSCVTQCEIGTRIQDSSCISCTIPELDQQQPFIIENEFFRVGAQFKQPIEVVDDTMKSKPRTTEFCSYLFDVTTLRRLGTIDDYYCDIDENILYIKLGTTFTFENNLPLNITSGKLQTKDCPESKADRIQIYVNYENYSLIPSAELHIPTRMYSEFDFTILLRNIKGNANKPLSKVKWSLKECDSSLTQESLSTLKENLDLWENDQKLEISGGILPIGKCIFSVSLENWIGDEGSSASEQIEIINDLVLIPDSELITTYYVNRTESVYLEANFIDFTENMEMEYVHYSEYSFYWEKISSHEYSAEVDLSDQYHHCHIPPLSLKSTSAEDPYIFMVTISKDEDPSIFTVITYYIHVSDTLPRCKMFGVGPKYMNEVIRITGDNSFDYTSRNPNFSFYELKMTWTCVDQNGNSCVDIRGSIIPEKAGLELKFDPYTFYSNSVLKIKLTCLNEELQLNSFDTGVLTIKEPNPKILDLYCPYHIFAYPSVKLPLACEVKDDAKRMRSDLIYTWITSDFPDEAFLNEKTSQYLIIDGRQVQRAESYKFSINAYCLNSQSTGIGEFDITVLTTPLSSSLEVEKKNEYFGLDQIFHLQAYSICTDGGSQMRYEYFWAIEEEEYHWNYITISYSTNITTTNKPCAKIVFKVVSIQENGARSSILSDIIDNDLYCEDKSIDEYLIEVDDQHEIKLVEVIERNLYFLQTNDQLAYPQIQSLKSYIIRCISHLQELRIDENLYMNELDTFLIHASNHVFQTFSTARILIHSKVLSCLVFFLEKEKQKIIEKGTSKAKKLNTKLMSEFSLGMPEELIFETVDTINMMIDLQTELEENDSTYICHQIVSLILKTVLSFLKNIYPFENDEGIYVTKENFRIYLKKSFLSYFKNILVKLTYSTLWIGENGLNLGELNIDDSIPRILIFGELSNSIFSPYFSVQMGEVVPFLVIVNEQTQEAEYLEGIGINNQINITLQLNSKAMTHEQTNNVTIQVMNQEDYNFSTSTNSNYSNTFNEVVFSVDQLNQLTYFIAQPKNFYKIILGNIEYEVEASATHFKSKNYSHNIC